MRISFFNVDNALNYSVNRIGVLRNAIALLLLAILSTRCLADEKINWIPFDDGLTQWAIEQMRGGSVVAKDGVLVIDDRNGCTIWLRQKLTAPVEISYDVKVVMNGGSNDRVSDINCFWMATDPASPGRPAGRSGKFADYDSLRLYYVGMGGNANTTTRFRRYAGDGSKPLLSGYDLSSANALLAPNVTYHLRIVARDGVAEFWRDGGKLFPSKIRRRSPPAGSDFARFTAILKSEIFASTGSTSSG